MICSICSTCSGSAEIRRAAVVCSPSWRTPITSSVAIRLAKAPKVLVPRIRAAIIVKPYVATLITAMATAIDPLLRK
jgi:hypothetical protein